MTRSAAILGATFLFCVAFFTTSVQGQLDASLLSIFSVDPTEPGWPVVLAAEYLDSQVSLDTVVWTWSFPGLTDQSCTALGRPLTYPCRAKVVEKTWPTSGTFLVSLMASIPGVTAISVSKNITIESFNGSQVARMEVRSLPPDRWIQLVSALHRSKALGIHDHFVYLHQVAGFTGIRAGSNRNAAHRGPAFLPWHRTFLHHYEKTLQTIANDSSLGLPYWDWTIDQGLAAGPLTSPVWNDTLFGPNGNPSYNYAVTSGPFCSAPSVTCEGLWPIPTQLGGPRLQRELGRISRRLPSSLEVQHILTVGIYDSGSYDDRAIASRSFRQALEGWAGGTFYGQAHNGVHSFVGGSMGAMTSPSDPVFFLHHCNVDRTWYRWQVLFNCYNGCYRPWAVDPTVTQATPGAQQVNGVWRIVGHHWGDLMSPWSVATSDVADVNNSLRGYYYV